MGKKIKKKKGKSDLPKDPPLPPVGQLPPMDPPEDTPQGDSEDLSELSSQTTIIPTVVDESEPEVVQYPNSPEPEGWRPKIGKVPKVPITRVHALGDLHGWAPGLITYLTKHQLAKIEINGQATYSVSKKDILSIDENAMREIFPHPLEYRDAKKTGHFPGAGLCGLDLNDGVGPWKYGQFDIKAEWIGHDTDPSACFVQIGDVFDRSDYNELGAEILRQLVIQAPMRVFVLVGNHEQFMLENDFDNWYYNEARWAFDPKKHNNGDAGFHTRFHTQTYNWTAKQSETTGPLTVFKQYTAATAVLYLTQACVLAKTAGMKIPEELNSEIILNGGFDAYREAMSYLQNALNSASRKSPMIIPGAFTTLGIGHTLFVHAEVAGFSDSATVDTLNWQTCGVAKSNNQIVYTEYRQVNSGINSSPDFPLLWERNSSHGSTSNPPTPACADYIQNLVEKMPGIRHYVHGHTPVPGVSWFNESPSSIASYVARDFSKAPTRSKGSVRMHMIDEGICPVYYTGPEGLFDPTRIPIGLQVHPSVAKFQAGDLNEQSKIETIEDDWHHMIPHGFESQPFFVPERISLSQPTGIGAFGESALLLPELKSWGDSFCLPDSIGKPKWRVIMDDYSEIESTLSMLIFPASGELETPVRVPMETPNGMANVPFDRLIFDICKSEIENFASLGFNTDDLTREDGHKWISKIADAGLERLGEHRVMVENFGPLSMLKSSGSCYFSMFFTENGTVQILVLNGTPDPVYFTLVRLLPDKTEGKPNSVEGGHYYVQEFSASDFTDSTPYEFQITLDKPPEQSLFKSKSHFIQTEEKGTAAHRLNEVESFGMVLWPKMNFNSFDWDLRRSPLPEWKVPEPTIESTETVIPDPINPSLQTPPPPPIIPSELPPPPRPAEPLPINNESLPINNESLPINDTEANQQSKGIPLRGSTSNLPLKIEEGALPFKQAKVPSRGKSPKTPKHPCQYCSKTHSKGWKKDDHEKECNKRPKTDSPPIRKSDPKPERPKKKTWYQKFWALIGFDDGIIPVKRVIPMERIYHTKDLYQQAFFTCPLKITYDGIDTVYQITWRPMFGRTLPPEFRIDLPDRGPVFLSFDCPFQPTIKDNIPFEIGFRVDRNGERGSLVKTIGSYKVYVFRAPSDSVLRGLEVRMQQFEFCIFEKG